MKDFNKFNILLGKKIRSLRRARKVNQKLFAANVGMDERHLRRIEKGETNPTLEIIHSIATELDLSPSELLFIG